jgi:site-specific DNA recombinase
MRCGVCGGGVATWNRVRLGCVNARKGTCINKCTMRRDELETVVLKGLQHRLMDPDLVAVFCEEYTRHMNALTQEHNAAREGAKAELGRINRDLDRLVQALLDGAPARTVKDRMAHLEARKDVLEAQLAQGEDVKCRCTPAWPTTTASAWPICAKRSPMKTARPRRQRTCAR